MTLNSTIFCNAPHMTAQRCFRYTTILPYLEKLTDKTGFQLKKTWRLPMTFPVLVSRHVVLLRVSWGAGNSPAVWSISRKFCSCGDRKKFLGKFSERCPYLVP